MTMEQGHGRSAGCVAGGSSRVRPGASLWASALVLAGLVLVQVGRLATSAAPFESSALAGSSAARAGDIAILSAEAGNEDVLLVIDGRREVLLVYRIENQTTVTLAQKVSLPQVFADARSKALGGT